jgi:hypothetical protein
VVLGGRGKWVLLLTGLESEGKSWSTLPWQLKIIGDCNGSSLRRSLLFALVREKAHIFLGKGALNTIVWIMEKIGQARPGRTKF